MNNFFLATAAAILVILGLWLVAIYNRLVRLRTAVEGQWRQVDVELQRRSDLVPNLVKVVKGAATFESGVLDEVTQARAAALGAQNSAPGERGAAEEGLTSALKNLFAVAEAYPQLTATENFRELQDELANTEDRIAAARSFYNQTVEEYNGTRLTIPTRLVAAPLGFRQAEYFELNNKDSRDVPQVNLDLDSQ